VGWASNLFIERSPGTGEMTEFRVVSVDMFRTLVDLGSVEERMWRMILGDRFSESLVRECADRATNSMFNYLPQEGFISVKAMFAACFAELFDSIGIEYGPDEAASIWSKQHAFCKPYGDSMAFLNKWENSTRYALPAMPMTKCSECWAKCILSIIFSPLKNWVCIRRVLMANSSLQLSTITESIRRELYTSGTGDVKS
jgi:hypothetical protein